MIFESIVMKIVLKKKKIVLKRRTVESVKYIL